MKFRIEVKNKTGDPWWETYDKEEVVDEASGRAWAINLIEWFNSTLRNGEEKRYFTGSVEVLGKGTKKHRWRKKNIVTQADHHGAFDVMECERCGARARRYGLTSYKMQRGFTTKQYETCPGEILYLKRDKETG